MKRQTELIGAGRHPDQHHGAVNVPPYRTSTVIREKAEEMVHRRGSPFDEVMYGRIGTPTTFAFEEAMAVLENTDRAAALSSGMAACAGAILAVVKQGDHLLVQDSVYRPVRRLCDEFLTRMGIETSYFAPGIGADIEGLIRSNTRLIYLEAPGSQTFEIPDIPAIVEVAKAKGIYTAADNTWSTGYFYRPADHGVDFTVNAATKYIVGHSDAMLGVVACREDLFYEMKTVSAMFLGNCAGSEEMYLGLRGLRTLAVRLDQHSRNALAVAEWLSAHPAIDRVLYPALPDHPQHDLWKRDFRGASGLMSIVLKPVDEAAAFAFADGLHHFGLGASFGGYESLVLPFDPTAYRTVEPWSGPGPAIRLHIGLEDPEDLIEDLDAGLSKLPAA